MVGIFGTAEIVRPVEYIGTGSATTMGNTGSQEQPGKALRVLYGLGPWPSAPISAV